MNPFFNPRSVAVVGATKKVDKAGHVIFKNFAANKMRGILKSEIYPVNPGEELSSGFKEVGNAELEDQVVAAAKAGGTRVLGPNCLGVFSSKTGVDTLFLPETKVLSTGDDV